MPRRAEDDGVRRDSETDFIPPEQWFLRPALEAVIEGDELGDAFKLDVLDVLLRVLPGEGRADDEKSHGERLLSALTDEGD